MSAVKLIFKRSSILGKRPSSSNLSPGEIALNTNTTDPGLFFETNNGSVAKVGPTAYLPEAPTSAPSLGELWVDTDTKTLRIGTDAQKWQTVAAPFLGGTNGLTVFVAPEYSNATDSLANDGQTVPFKTINRAVIEVAKQIILLTNSGLGSGNNRYLIVLAPGRHCVVNGPGSTVFDFTVDYTSLNAPVYQADLQSFNDPVTGGLILPRGVSIIGLDLKKCEVHPTYVPTYTHPAFAPNYQQDPNGGPTYENQPLSSIFRWSGNTYLSQFSYLDKVESRTVVAVSNGISNLATFRTDRPHGLGYNDFVRVTYTNSADQAGAAFLSGVYYAQPVNSYEFTLSTNSWEAPSYSVPVLGETLPPSMLAVSAVDSPKFQVESIYPYYKPTDGTSYELSPYSHHRLSGTKNASRVQLNEFYTKVQKAFPTVFAGTVNTSIADAPEYEIVAPTDGLYPLNTTSNNTSETSPEQNTVSLRSNYGMANGDYDGTLVTGFRSVTLISSSAVSLQKDPAAYELYANTDQQWHTLTVAGQQSLPPGTPVTAVPTNLQLQLLNNASIANIRYHYKTVLLNNTQSTGLSDIENDFRHFGFRQRGTNSYLSAEELYTVGSAIGVWAKDGATISLTNSTTNFGSVAIQSEGFSGIGTLGGANEINKGFLQAGISRPLALIEPQVIADSQKTILSLGSKVVFVGPDPDNPGVQLIYLQSALNPATLLPYSLRPDSAVFISDGTCIFRAFFVTNGQPTCVLSESDPLKNPYSLGGAILRVRSTDSNIPSGSSNQTCLEVPYIRRYLDPRTATQRAYGFYVQTTNPTTQAPQLGSVLRLNQTGQSLSSTIKRNYQFDPGQFGGVAQVFTVDLVETAPYNQSVNFNNKISDTAQATSYTVYATLTDAGFPWLQSTPDSSGLYTPYNTPTGSYSTFDNRNYFSSENNLWSDLYYETTFNPLNGPTKVSPDTYDSPFVTTSVLERQESVFESWQGYVPDPLLDYYTNDVPSPYKQSLTYMRGAVVPYQDFASNGVIDIDDGTASLGIIFTREVTTLTTTTTDDSSIVQTPLTMTSPFSATPTFGRPEIISLSLLQVSQLVNPKNGLCVVQLSKTGIDATEYVRVVGLVSNQVIGVRDYYPEYSVGTPPAVWPAGTTVKVCVATCYPEPSVYDPDWSVTKATMFRYYQLMGYDPTLIAPYLTPRYAGERLLLNTDLTLAPINGYANVTASWPVEFNNPSTIYANNHNWQYVGYYDYSRGLPKYQASEISRKLRYDYMSTTAWGGRLTIFGSDENGSVVTLGPVREALTGNFYEYNTPAQNLSNNIVTPTPTPINYPSPILVYSADDISGQFNGTSTNFNLTRGGTGIPVSQLTEIGLFVTVGGVMQIPGVAYTLGSVGGITLPVIIFSSAPPQGASCDIRVVTSDDNEKTLEVIRFTTPTPFDGVTTNFPLEPGDVGVNNNNSFIFLSGVAQMPQGSGHPDPSYTITNIGLTSTLSFLGSSPPAGLDYDFRCITSALKYRNTGYPVVYITSVDDISVFFDGAIKSFPLYVNNVPLDSQIVNAESMFVSLGAVIQIPHQVAGNPLAGNAYTITVNSVTKLLEINFAEAPLPGTTCNIRVISSQEFIVCPLPPALETDVVVAGDGITVNENNEIINIDPGLIGP